MKERGRITYLETLLRKGVFSPVSVTKGCEGVNIFELLKKLNRKDVILRSEYINQEYGIVHVDLVGRMTNSSNVV
jgi:hypothetical protein